MDAVLLAAAVAALLVLVTPCALGLWCRRTLRRRNRVGAQPSAIPAPISWLALPTAPARLHRRLVITSSSLRLAVPPPSARATRKGVPYSELTRLAGEIELQAVALDAELVVRRRDRAAVAHLTSAAVQLEAAAGCVVRSAAAAALRPGAPTTHEAIELVASDAAALEAAYADLAVVEASAGLRSH
jgi:hypothetical protein